MSYLIGEFWFPMLMALGLGLAVGWMTFRGDAEALWRGLIPWGLLLGLGALVTALRVFPDGIGFWVDLFFLLATAYLIGCLIGYMGRVSRGAGPAMASAGLGVAASGGAVQRALDPMAGMPASAPPTPAAAKAVPEAEHPNQGAAKPVEPAGPAEAATPVEVAVEPAATTASVAVAPVPEEAITGLSRPRHGQADDLTRIYGIDAEIETKLNALGIYHYDQFTAMRPGQRRWLFARLGHEGRFPSWWWRWRFDAEQILAGRNPDGTAPDASPGLMGPASPEAESPPSTAIAAGPAKPADAARDAAAGEPLEGSRPVGLSEARDGKADDLKRIRGIGKQNEGRLHALGIWHFDQIAQWSAEETRWVGSYLAFPGRIEREDWVGQAKVLAGGGVTDFAKRVDRGEVATSRDDSNDDGQGNVAKLDKPVTKPAQK